MSSTEDDANDENQNLGQESRKRSVRRACDACRRKKIRCDGVQMPQNRCLNCITSKLECTYVEAAKRRGPPKGYVESLEIRLERTEKLLQKLRPELELIQEIGTASGQENQYNERWQSDRAGFSSAHASRQDSPTRRLTTSATPAMATSLSIDPDDLAVSDDELGYTLLTEDLERLSLKSLDGRFRGKSSGVTLVQAAMNLKREFSGSALDTSREILVPPNRRMEFWSPHPWEMIVEKRIMHLHYPDEDLLPKLVENYFVHINTFSPVLHRPSFERTLAENRHHSDIGFGSVLLLVCAIGARWTDDSRVYLERTTKHSAGWKWFDQVHMIRKSMLSPPRLYDLQIFALTSLYLHGSSSPQASWTTVGVGIRLAQDVGAHRRKVYNAPLSVESELWKRAFWVLISLDRMGSATLGRPCSIQEEDFDLDLPLEVDDEYWEHPDPSKAFKQPPGVPAKVAFFNSFLKLIQILSLALRTIYSINKSKILLGFVGPKWEQHIVAELDSAMNKWMDIIPDHLRWDPHRKDFLHFSQSAALYAAYYHVQILIHRPFIPSPRKPSPLTFPSLAICTNAARLCSHVADIQYKRGSEPLVPTQVAIFTAGIVLLLDIWGAKRSGVNSDPAKQMADVYKCMKALSCTEERWEAAGKLWDILYELASMGDFPLPANTLSGNERERDGLVTTMPPASTISIPQTSYTSSAAINGTNPRPTGDRQTPGSIPNTDIPFPFRSTPAASLPVPHPSGPFGPGMGMPPSRGGPCEPTTPWYSAGSTNVQTTAPVAAARPFSNSANLNVFDLYQSDPELLDMLLGDNIYQPHQQQRQQSGVSTAANSARMPDGVQQFSDELLAQAGTGSGVQMNQEALQMWSTVPGSFGMEDWGSYLHNISTAPYDSSGQQQQAAPNAMFPNPI